MTSHFARSDAAAALVDNLVGLMQLEQIEVDLFRGPITSEPWTRVFGGQVIGQALMAACRTVEAQRMPHSLHGYFIRPGDPEMPILYRVSRDRDGGSFSSRRVVAIQRGKPILNLACSFQIAEPGWAHELPMPEVPPPEALENDSVLAHRNRHLIPENRRQNVLRRRPIELRPTNPVAHYTLGELPPYQAHWFRAVAPLPDDQNLQRVLLAYASDMKLLSVTLLPHGFSWIRGEAKEASLDHSLWIHDDLRLDDWLLYIQDSPWSGGARGLCRGSIYTREGRLVATVAQEGLIRGGHSRPMRLSAEP